MIIYRHVIQDIHVFLTSVEIKVFEKNIPEFGMYYVMTKVTLAHHGASVRRAFVVKNDIHFYLF